MAENSVLVVHSNQIKTSIDNDEQKVHYAVSLISKMGDEVEVTKYPIDVEKYGRIRQIVITDGKVETLLPRDKPLIDRLIKYFSTDLATLRSQINDLDRDGHFSNKCEAFDCQHFSHYLMNGKEGVYSPGADSEITQDYREKAKHREYGFYSMKGYKAHTQEVSSLHHYVCLAEDVFVSKYGSGGVFFTSFQHIIDAYFPPEFVKGTFSVEW